MRHLYKIKTLGLAGLMTLVAMLAISAVGAASASALRPHFKYCVHVEPTEPSEWKAGCKVLLLNGGFAKVFPPARHVAGAKWCVKVESEEPSEWGNQLCTLRKAGFNEWIKFDVKTGVTNPNAFKSTGGEKILKIAGAPESEWIKCTSAENVGEFTGPTTDKVTITFKGCKTFFGLVTCTSTGAASGTIVTKELNSLLVYINHTTKEVGLDLSPVTGNFTEEIKCSTVKILVRGSVIGKFASSSVNTVTNKFTLEFKVNGSGEQVPSEYEAEEPEGSGTWVKHKDTLECSTNGGTSWKACTEQEVTPDEITTEEEGEIAA